MLSNNVTCRSSYIQVVRFVLMSLIQAGFEEKRSEEWDRYTGDTDEKESSGCTELGSSLTVTTENIMKQNTTGRYDTVL